MSIAMTLKQAMQRALVLAEQALFITSPNPRVGCVILNENGMLIGEGHTQKAGQAHAEVMALRGVQEKGLSARGAVAHVTLEPCAHHGRTGPCSQALIAAGIAQVFVALLDPNPLVAGQGIAQLRAAGIKVFILPQDGVEANQAKALNLGYLHRVHHGQVWLRLKVAASLDGRTALPNGISQWITGEAARQDGHHWRARACAVLTGAGTVVADDPAMTVRGLSTSRQPHRILIDSGLRSPVRSKIFQFQGVADQAAKKTLIYAAHPEPAAHLALTALGIDVRCFANTQRQVDLSQVMFDLASLEFNEIHVEAGAVLNAALLQADLVDEILLYISPQLLGDGRGIAHLTAPTKLAIAPLWIYHDVRQVGQDLRIVLRRSKPRLQI
jgi:diaminohydroxyphosphoribosylaminopyrimidine deaminase / 5-amino-6-(5-phosphoribosylamino)uracil reductase